MEIKKLFSLVNILLLIAILIYPCYYISWKYPIERDVWTVLDRAQLSAESEGMTNYTKIAIQNLENKKSLFTGMPQTQGHCAMIFKTPKNDLGEQHRILKNILIRLERTDEFDKNSVEYQAAIDDIRGTIRELGYLDCWIWHFK